MPDIPNEILVSAVLGIVPFLVLLAIGLSFGTITQMRHLADLDRREAALPSILLTNISSMQGSRGALVTGSTVVAYDFFRRVAILLRKLVGGRFRMHETLMMRARREAVLRMAEAAADQGAVAVHNIRLISSNLGDSGSATGGCEVVAYGTAIWDEA